MLILAQNELGGEGAIRIFGEFSFGEQMVPTQGSGKYCRYLCYDGDLEGLAGSYGRQPIDLLDHPAYDQEYRHLIHNETYNYLCKWRGPLIEKTEFDYPPFSDEELEYFENRPKAFQSRIKLSRAW